MNDPTDPNQSGDSWQQFGAVVRAALAVPKKEIVKSMEKEKKQKQRREKKVTNKKKQK